MAAVEAAAGDGLGLLPNDGRRGNAGLGGPPALPGVAGECIGCGPPGEVMVRAGGACGLCGRAGLGLGLRAWLPLLLATGFAGVGPLPTMLRLGLPRPTMGYSELIAAVSALSACCARDVTRWLAEREQWSAGTEQQSGFAHSGDERCCCSYAPRAIGRAGGLTPRDCGGKGVQLDGGVPSACVLCTFVIWYFSGTHDCCLTSIAEHAAGTRAGALSQSGRDRCSASASGCCSE